MVFSPWKNWRNRKAQAADKKQILLAEKRRRWGRLNLERLEDRLAPAAPLAFTISSPSAVTLLLNGTDLQIVESADHTNVLAHQALSSTSEVDVTGAPGTAFLVDVNTFTPTSAALTATLDTPAAGHNRISVSGVSFAPVDFSSIPTVTLDGSTRSGNETVNFTGGDSTHVLVATGLQNFTVDTGNGMDKVAITASSFALPAGGGTFTVSTGSGDDTLDLTNFDTTAGPLTISDPKTEITAHDGSVLTQATPVAEHVDVNLASSVKTTLDSALDKLKTLASNVQSDVNDFGQLAKQLPLLSRNIQGGLAQLLAFSQKIQDFTTNAKNTINSIASNVNLSAILNDLSGITLPTGFGSITFTSDYRRAPGDSTASTGGELEVLIDVHLTASASADIPIDLGASAQDIGLSLTANLHVGTTLTGDLSVGLTTDPAP
ncbi:MAG TPA: hypothetical protein VG099_27665, partial [Gemmataceae bacterium]|nr:hypothetical protein [Gemmataceae bacterium]